MSLLSTPTVILAAPTGVVGQYFGDAGTGNTYYYWVQAIYPSGTSPLSTSTGPFTVGGLTKNNYIYINWNGGYGAIGYNIFRTTTSTAPGAGTNYLTTVSSANFSDNGIFTISTSYIARNGVYMARMYYDFAVDAGAIGSIIPVQSDTIPAGAIINNGWIYSPTAATSGGSATIGVGTSAGSTTTSLKAATAVASFSANAVLVTLAPTAPFKMTAAGQLQILVATATLLTGVIEVVVEYTFPVNN